MVLSLSQWITHCNQPNIGPNFAFTFNFTFIEDFSRQFFLLGSSACGKYWHYGTGLNASCSTNCSLCRISCSCFLEGIGYPGSVMLLARKTVHHQHSLFLLFQLFYDLSVSENLPVRSFVGRVRAVDKDGDQFGKIVYRLSGEGSESFSIDAVNGEH